MTATVCFTFDNMGAAAEVGAGRASAPDPDEPGLLLGYPRLLDLLDDLGVRSTFFVEGWNGVHHPDRVAELADRGHEVGLHGWVHERWADLDRDRQRRLLERGCDALARCGPRPRGFRSPGGDRGPHTAALLAELGFDYDASLGDDLVPRVLPQGIAHVPFRWPGVDGYWYLRDDPPPPAAVAERWKRAATAAAENGTLVTYVAHAHISAVDDERFAALRGLLEELAGDPRFELVPAETVAARVRVSSGS